MQKIDRAVQIWLSLCFAWPVIAGTNAATAGTEKLDLLIAAYERCIVETEHLSDTDFKAIRTSARDLQSAADKLAELALASCKRERQAIIGLLKSNGKYNAEAEKAMEKTDSASMYLLKLQLLKSLLEITEDLKK